MLLLALELGLRLAGYAQTPAQYYDPAIGYRYRPSQSRALVAPGGVHFMDVVTNELGYRGPWHAGPPPPGVARIVCLGDSFTFGWGVEEPESFPAVLAELSGERAQVYNLGVPGYNTRNALAAYEHHARGLDADIVVLAYFQNDLQPDAGGPRHMDALPLRVLGKTALVEAFHRHLRRRVPLFDSGRPPELKARMAYWAANFEAIRDEPGRAEHAPFWDDSLGALRELAERVREDGAELLLVVLPGRDQVAKARRLLDRSGGAVTALAGHFPMQRRLAEEARALGLSTLDLLVPFARLQEDPWGEIDPQHPSAVGYRLIAERVAARLRELGLP